MTGKGILLPPPPPCLKIKNAQVGIFNPEVIRRNPKRRLAMRDQIVAITMKGIVDALEAAGVREAADVHAVERSNAESIHEVVALRGADARVVVVAVKCEADVHVVAVIRAVGIIDLPHRRPRHLLPRHRYHHLVAVAGDDVVNLLVFRQVWPLHLVSWIL